MRADRRDPNIRALKRMKATKFSIELRDGTTRDVTLSTKQNRWELLLDILDKMPWARIEGQDGEGKTVGVVEAEPDEEGDEDGEDVDYDPVAAATERISKQMMHVMVVTQQETRKGYEATMRGLSDMTRSMVDAVAMLRDTYTAAMRVRDMADVGKMEDPTGSGENVMKLLMLAQSLMQNQGKPPPVTINVPPNAPPASPPRPQPPKNGVAPKG